MSSLSRNLSDRIGSLGYLLDEKDSNGVNKAFLANTIRDVESHNRREQIDACWRAHRLQKMIGSKRQRDDDEVNRTDHSPNNKRQAFLNQRIDDPRENHTNEREKWALKKLQAFSKIPPSAESFSQITKEEFSIQRQEDSEQISSSSSSTSSSMSTSSQSSGSSRDRKRKKDKHSKKKMRKTSSTKKREKKSKKHKKERSKKKRKKD